MAPSRIGEVTEDRSDSEHESEVEDQPETTTETNGKTRGDAEIDPKKKVDAAEPMKAELKHLDRKYSEKHQWYYAETVEDKALPEQVDW